MYTRGANNNKTSNYSFFLPPVFQPN